MGCCGSKEDRDDSEVHAPLLANELPSYDGPTNSQTYDTFDVKLEQEFWNEIIERTTSNLIDISSAQNEPLQEQDVEERTERYRKVLDETSVQDHPADATASSTSLPHLEALADIQPNNGLDQSQVEWLYKAMDDIRDALEKFEINPVGDVVVNLTMTDNSVPAIRG